MSRLDDIRAVHKDHRNPDCETCWLLVYFDALYPQRKHVCPACGGKTPRKGRCDRCLKAGNEAQELFRG
jgi:predicted RNA-binding Zn-ribbon protein involved in translation (DUF1610 family)